MFARIFAIVLVTCALLLVTFPVHADEIEDLQKQINELNHARELSVSATKPLEGQLDSLQRQLAQIKSQLDVISANIQKKQTELKLREEKLVELTVIFNERVVEDYKNGYVYNPLGFIFGQSRLADKLYHLKTISENREVIKTVSSEILAVLTDKENLEKDKARIVAIQAEVDKNATFLGGEIKKAKAYQADLSQQIASLSQRQQELIAAKLASLNIPRSASSLGRCDSDLQNGRDPGFSPKFAAFTYGVPNRVGMSQFGAWGRAKAGQDANQILHAYYNFDAISAVNTSIQINVQGYGSFPLEDYVKRIYEVPDSWADNNLAALKAQAIAARSYALAYTSNGQGSICTSEQCQVFQPNPKGGNWEQAVNATSGQVMILGGQPIKAWFSSTHGGYEFSSGDIGWSSTPWTKRMRDTSGPVSIFPDLAGTAYDRESPWFYCDWGSRADYNKTAWLKSDELADIANVIMLIKRDSGVSSHIYQADKPNPEGVETWDEARIRQELQSRGGSPLGSVSSVSVSADFSSGQTTTVTVSGEGRSESFSGGEFKNFFNLRVPANIQIVGPLYNIEIR